MNKKIGFLIQAFMIVMMLLSILAQPPVSAGAAVEIPEGAPQNKLQGSVTLDGGGVPQGAVIAAWRGDKIFYSPVDPASGVYSVMLGAGDWHVTVSPGAPGLVSPAWIFEGDPQTVAFSANPDPVNPVQGLDFLVTSANSVISGKILPPQLGDTMADPNQVWVRAESQEGLGNTVLADPVTGAFSIRILPGNTSVRLAFQNERWAPPTILAGSIWYTGAEPVSTGDLQVRQKNARIFGVMLDDDLHPVAGMPVRAWRLDGSENARTTTLADGTFALWVIEGVWEVQVMPPASSPYLPAQNPKRVTLPTPTSQEEALLGVILADVTVNGTLVDAHNNAVPGLYGHVYGLYHESGVRWLQFGPGAAIKNSAFTLKLSSKLASIYKLKASFPTTAGYTLISDLILPVQPDKTYTVTLPVAVNNSTISGFILDHANGQPRLGLPGAIYGASDSGALKRVRVNPVDGSYLINAAATDTSGHGGTYWILHAFVDPTTQYQVMRPRTQKVFLPYNSGNGANVTADFVVAHIDALLTGRVLDEHGTPQAGVKVGVAELGSPAGLAFRRWVLTNGNGRFAIPLPAGEYRVSADFRNWLAPLPLTVKIAAGTVVDINADILHGPWCFREKNAMISGKVLFEGTANTAFIRAFSNTGAHVIGLTNAAGEYAIGVNSGDVWHVQAVGEEGDKFLKSERVKLIPLPGANPDVDLELLVSDTLPKGLAFTFDATQDMVITLSNGAQVIIPAYALATNGLVSLTVRPLAELADDGGAQPVSFGYRLLAFDENHVLITHFYTPVTLSMPFTADQLLALGVTPEQLIPSYWDVSSGSWKPVPNYSLQVNPDQSGSLNLSIDHFTDYGMMTEFMPFKVFVPQVSQ